MNKLWYTSEARRWEEALPVGNGRIGAMVFSGTNTDKISVNEDTLWSGAPGVDKVKQTDKKWLDGVKKLVADGEYVKAQSEVEDEILHYVSQVYLPWGEIYISKRNIDSSVFDYKRELTLSSGIVGSEYLTNGYTFKKNVYVKENMQPCKIKFTQEVFTSFADDVLVIHMQSEGAERLDMQIGVAPALESKVTSKGNTVEVCGRCPTNSNVIGEDEGGFVYDDGESVRFCAKMTAVADSVISSGGFLRIKGAEATIIFSIATSYNGSRNMPVSNGRDCAAICQKKLENALTYSYASLKERHIKAFEKEYGETEFCLDTEENTEPTDILLQKVKNGEKINEVTELLFNYGRYLLLCSSRKGTQPANLQGIWNNSIMPVWKSNYTVNINTEMNYWGAEAAGLGDCHVALADMLLYSLENGRETARRVFCAEGWCMCHNTDLWRFTNPSGDGARSAFWPLGGAWLSRHIWEHYEYTNNIEFLKKYFCILKESAEFIESIFYEENGKMRPYMGTSPENAFLADGKIAVIAKYTAMDLSIARDVMLNTAKACEVLGLDSAKYKNYAERIQPLKIGSDGRLLEWNEELPEAEPGHRHLSHLYGVYPSDLIKQGTPEYDAAKKSLEYRLANGGGHTGWSSAWNINVAARFGNGEKAYEFIKTLIKCQLMNNLFDMHPFSFHSVFQIDGNLGFMSGICEMLAYADKDKVVLLPAVPDEWKCGSVKGLCLKGGRKLDIKWDGGRIISYRIYDAKSGKTISNVKTESPRFAL